MTTTPETSSPTHAWGIGLATLAADASTLDVWYPAPNPGPAQEAPEAHPLYAQLESAARADEERGTTQEVVVRAIELSAPPADAAAAYLRLHLLSHRLVQPNTQNLERLFGKLPNVAWTPPRPCEVPAFEETAPRPTPPTPACACSCSPAAWSSPTPRTSRACSASSPMWCGPRRAPARCRASRRRACACSPRAAHRRWYASTTSPASATTWCRPA